jgi:hypothetical protein
MGCRAIQCGEKARMISGRGKACPSAWSIGPALPGSSGSMGEP